MKRVLVGWAVVMLAAGVGLCAQEAKKPAPDRSADEA